MKEWVHEKKEPTEYALEVVQRMEEARERVRKEVKKQKEKMKETYDKGRKKSDYKVADLVWLKNEIPDKGQHYKMAKQWLGPYRIIKIHKDGENVVELRSVWNRMDQPNVNIALLKKAFMREGDVLPMDVERPHEKDVEKGKEEKEKEKATEEEEKINEDESLSEEEKEIEGKKRKRGRRAKKTGKTKRRKVEQEERRVRNREGRTLQKQRERDGEKTDKWTEEELQKEWEIDRVIQELAFDDGKKHYLLQFKGFKKKSDGVWRDEKTMKKEHNGFLIEWERRKRELGVIERNKIQDKEIVGRTYTIAKKR